MGTREESLAERDIPGTFRVFILLNVLAFSISGCGMYKQLFPPGPPELIKLDSVRSENRVIGGKVPRSDAFSDRFSVYLDSVKQFEARVLTHSKTSLSVGKPEGTLNNLVADMVRWHVERVRRTNIDVAFIPYRLLDDSLKAGPVRVSDIYSVLPENRTMALYEVNGAAIQWLANVIAQQQGGAVSGLRMRIDSARARDVVVGSHSLRRERHYKLVAPISFMCKHGWGHAANKRHPMRRIPGEYIIEETRPSDIQIFQMRHLSMRLREMVIAYLDHQIILDRQLDHRIRL